jgi:osmotically-inducible protein OsmY
MKSDKQVQKDVMAELDWEPSVNAAHIGVEVKDGVVTLAGHVSSWAEKYHAEHAAQRVSGVKALAVEMDVNLPGVSKRTDSDIAASAKGALQWTTFAPNDAVKVKVENGQVTLTGELDWEYQRLAAAWAVRYLLGVTGVSNLVTLRHAASSKVVQSDIEAALKRRAHDDAQKVAVTVNGGDVTLTGSVHSMDERDVARGAAWRSPGVRSVADELAIVY